LADVDWTVQIQGPKALVHWWYWPDSYDEWIPVDNISGDPEEDEEPPAQWTVYQRWIRDSYRFNEVMNPIDYLPEVASPDDKPSSRKINAYDNKKEDNKKDENLENEILGVPLLNPSEHLGEVLPGHSTLIAPGA
jgi:SWI/SNF related-matrix-associated actin-dependent regulator of chromatin subfamily C